MNGDHDGSAEKREQPDDRATGLPWPRSWRGVYVLVAVVFGVWVLCLVLLPIIFS